MDTTRRGFLGYLLGSGTAAVAAKIIEPTPDEVAMVKSGQFDFACMPRGGVWIRDVQLDRVHDDVDVTRLGDSAYRRFVQVESAELTVRMGISDIKRGMEIANFFAERIGKLL